MKFRKIYNEHESKNIGNSEIIYSEHIETVKNFTYEELFVTSHPLIS